MTDDSFRGVVLQSDGTVVLGGSTGGDFSGVSAGGEDFAVMGVDAISGEELWRWQVLQEAPGAVQPRSWNTSCSFEQHARARILHTPCLDVRASVVCVAFSSRRHRSLRVHNVNHDAVRKNPISISKGGSAENDSMLAVAGAPQGASTLAGWTEGSWGAARSGGRDFFAVLLDTNVSIPAEAPTPAPTPSLGRGDGEPASSSCERDFSWECGKYQYIILVVTLFLMGLSYNWKRLCIAARAVATANSTNEQSAIGAPAGRRDLPSAQ